LDKEKWAHEYLNENKTMGVNVTKGGLMEDWNFII
jgi:flavin reductase (DIM6/NTAB) family NADH-FMN oxidoreductase RutF